MTAPPAASPGGADLDPGLGQALAAAALTLARRFSAGGTLWCLSPRWPHHARHVAVEFVHPVVVGTRALPALLAPPGDPVAALRVAARPGDVVLAVADGGDPAVADVLRRGPAWGVDTVWVGAGERPPAGAADHVLWLADAHTAPYDGSFLLLYHVLWELTSVCFDHPGLLQPAAPCAEEVCITCSDEGRLVEVVGCSGPTATVLAAGRTEEVDTTLVGAVQPGELLLVHAGAALTRVGAS